VRFAAEHDAGQLEQLTPVLLDDFLASRSRPRPRGFNHLLGVVGRLLDWAVAHELLEASPRQTRPRRETATRIPFLFDTTQARQLLDAAAALPDCTQALRRGATYRTIFALCYGLGLRVGEASALRVGDVDRTRSLLVVTRAPPGVSHPCCPACVTRSRSPVCCVSTDRALTRPRGFSGSRRSWATATPSQRPST
jgi:integrase